MHLEYWCPEYGDELFGRLGEDVFCEACGLTFETDWDYESDDSMTCWIVRRSRVEEENQDA